METKNENKRQEVRNDLTIVDVKWQRMKGVMENGIFVAKSEAYLKDIPEEQIANVVNLTIEFDNTIKHCTSVDGKTIDVDTHILSIRLRKWIPKICINDTIVKVKKDLAIEEAFTRYMRNAKLTVTQKRHSINDVDDKGRVYTTDGWSFDIQSFTLAEDVETFIQRVLETRDEKLFALLTE